MSDDPSAPEPLRLERRRQRPLLQVERLSKVFSVGVAPWGNPRLLRAVDGLSLFVRHGECVGLVGHADSGKSVAANTIFRLTEPTYGRVLLGERDITRFSASQMRAARKDMQILLQNASATLNPRLTLGRQIEDGLRIHRVFAARSEARERVSGLLQALGMPLATARAYPSEVSTGQRQRVALARVLALEPKLLLLDEPMRALDSAARERIVELIQAAQADKKMASLLVTRDAPLVRRLTQRAGVLYAGRLIETATTEELFERRAHPYTRALLGEAAPARTARPRLRVVLEGQPLDPLSRPRGCAFHPRCPRAEKGRCDVEGPELRSLDAERRHRVACHHPYS